MPVERIDRNPGRKSLLNVVRDEPMYYVTLARLRVHSCPHCDLVLGRDHNAGRNILALGMSAAGVSLQNVRDS